MCLRNNERDEFSESECFFYLNITGEVHYVRIYSKQGSWLCLFVIGC